MDLIKPAIYPYRLLAHQKTITECSYSLNRFGMNANSESGSGIQIAIIGSGTAKHKDISQERVSEVNLYGKDDVVDNHGYSTMLSGIILANSKSIKGFCPLADMLFIKSINNKIETDHRALAASILWSTIKNADIIILPALPEYFSDSVNNAIQKAYDLNILLLGFKPNKTSKIAILYPKVFFVKSPFKKQSGRRNINEYSKNVINICISPEKVYTTFLQDTYIQPPQYIEALGIFAGLLANVLQQKKENMIRPSQETIINHVLSIGK